MDKFTEIKEGIKSLITDKTSAEDAEKLGKLAGKIDEVEKENKTLFESKEALRLKYVDLVTTASFGTTPNPEIESTTKKAVTLEGCIAEVQKKK